MTQEQKAAAYDKALEIARKNLEAVEEHGEGTSFAYDGVKNTLIHIFPELAESEDEKIRKDMIDTIKQEAQGFPSSIIAEKSNKWIAWLEKQGKQKPAQKQKMVVPLFRVGDTIRVKNSDAKYTITDISDGYYRGKGWCLDIVEGDASGDYELVERESMWSEEDEARLSVAIDCCERGGKNAIGNWLKSFRDRVLPQPKQEWSDEDNEHIKSIISTIECSKAQFPNSPAVLEAYNSDLIWLKSLRPQFTWKPSELQIEALESATENCAYSEYQDCLRQLIEQLKILKE